MKNTKGFSLIEVLIFVSILSIFFVIASSVTVVSVRNMKISEHRILATHYGEQLIEWLRDEKESDWEAFFDKSGNSYCFNETQIDDWPTNPGACTTNGLLNIFSRDVILSTDVSQVNVKITVSWQELGNNYQVPLTTVFTRWED